MQIEVSDSKITGYATVGMISGGIEVNEAILPPDFFDEWYPEKFLYIDGVVSEDPNFVPPEPPEPEPTPDEEQVPDGIPVLPDEEQVPDGIPII